jgi:hypothetical protein
LFETVSRLIPTNDPVSSLLSANGNFRLSERLFQPPSRRLQPPSRRLIARATSSRSAARSASVRARRPVGNGVTRKFTTKLATVLNARFLPIGPAADAEQQNALLRPERLDQRLDVPSGEESVGHPHPHRNQRLGSESRAEHQHGKPRGTPAKLRLRAVRSPACRGILAA